MKLGAVIRAERERRKWSIDALVERLGEIRGGDRSSLSKIENEDRWPRPEMLEALARAFDMRPYQLIAMAEGATEARAPAYLEQDEKRLLDSYRTMEPEGRYHFRAVGEALSKQTEDGGRPKRED